MKILIVTNLYPPHFVGGYELRCAAVADALARAGHEVAVLTSIYGVLGRKSERAGGIDVYRWLNEYQFGSVPKRRPWTLYQGLRELSDSRKFVELVTKFRPDIVNWWNMCGLTKLPLAIARSMKLPDVYWVEDPWIIRECGPAGEKVSRFWNSFSNASWSPRVCRPLLALAARGLRKAWEPRLNGMEPVLSTASHACFVSASLRDHHREAGIVFDSAEVIFGGIEVEKFYTPRRQWSFPPEPLRLLYAGQFTEDRGLHILIEAIGRLPSELRRRVRLTAAGEGVPEYSARIENRIRELSLDDIVSTPGKLPYEQVPLLYRTHDVLIAPSLRAEGLPLSMVEAMLAGCAVVTTGSGGAMEIASAADLPLFPKEDISALSRLIATLITDRDQVGVIAKRAQQVALEQFSLSGSVNRFNITLEGILAGGDSGPARAAIEKGANLSVDASSRL